MTLQGCLNGVRGPEEHPGLPVTPDGIAKSAMLAARAGADTVHVHVKDGSGADTLDAHRMADVLDAIRDASPGLPVGVSTGAWMQPDLRRRLRAVESWHVLPDFASVNWHEEGSGQVADLLVERGIGVEAGLWFVDAVDAWATHRTRELHQRVLLELPDGLSAHSVRPLAGEMVSLAREVTDLPILVHGEGGSAWPAVRYAVEHALDARIGLEDTLLLPDGSPALGNEDLVAAACALRRAAGTDVRR